jgi:hypothetical protein
MLMKCVIEKHLNVVELTKQIMSGDKYHLILMVLVTISIIGGLASIVIWNTQPGMRMTLVVDHIEASISAAVVAVLNIVALLGIRMKAKWGPLLVIGVTIPNRIVGLFHFEVNAGQGLFIAWSAILIVFALLDYMWLSKKE